MLSIIIIILISILYCYAMQVPLCNVIQYSNHLMDCSQNTEVFSYSFKIEATKNEDFNRNQFPNLLTYYNFSTWSLNSSVYYQDGPLSVWYLKQHSHECFDKSEKCSGSFQNGIGHHSLPVVLKGKPHKVHSNMGLFFENGNVFTLLDVLSEKMFDGRCVERYNDRFCQNGTDYYSFESACCLNYISVTVPDYNKDTCQEYSTEIDFLSPTGLNNYMFHAFQASPSSKVFVDIKGPNGYSCSYSETNATNDCLVDFPMNIFNNLIILTHAYKYQFAYQPLEGRFVYQNNTFLKYEDFEYMRNEDCWNQTAERFNTTIKTSHCCLKYAAASNENQKVKPWYLHAYFDAPIGLLIAAIFMFIAWRAWIRCKSNYMISKVSVVPREHKSVTISTIVSETFSDIAAHTEPTIHVYYNDVLGKGSTCSVYSAKLRTKLVAIKIPTQYFSSHLEDIIHEVNISAPLKGHPNICAPIVWLWYNNIPCIIFEKLETSLYQIVRESPSPNPKIFLTYLWHISKALEFVASKGLIHRDVATRNILISKDNEAKLSDFGLCCRATEDGVYFASSRKSLPLQWLAPEALVDNLFSEESDVWSFGVTMYEIWSHGNAPYSGLPIQELKAFLQNGGRLEVPEDMGEAEADIMRSCWWPNRNDRPNFMTLKENFEQILGVGYLLNDR